MLSTPYHPNMEKDFIGTYREMRKALIEAGYKPSDLRQSRLRGTAPPSWKTGIYRLYRWSEVEAWVKARQRQHKIDLGASALGRWLETRETAWRFATRTGIPLRAVYRLLGHKTSLWRDAMPSVRVLTRIAAETGIPIEQLIADAPEEPF